MDELHKMMDDEMDRMIDEDFVDLLHRVGEMEVAHYAATIDTEKALRDLYRRAGVTPPPAEG